MSQTAHRDIEGGGDLVYGSSDHPQSLQRDQQAIRWLIDHMEDTEMEQFLKAIPGVQERRSNFGDSSGPLFSIYFKAVEDEDNEMVKGWKKDANGMLIFTGLFSAAVAALLAVTVQDLKPDFQESSAFYLGNIYQVLADPNVTNTSILPPVVEPPPFSPPRYAVWVNSLWVLSLIMGLSCGLLAFSLHQWAHRYISLALPAQGNPEKRARMHAFFANGLDKVHFRWAVEGLPKLLHLSLFLFFAGLVILIFNLNHEVFSSVVWWIILFSMLYGLITLLPLIRHDSTFYSPLSRPTWTLYTGTLFVTFNILAFITYRLDWSSYSTWHRCSGLRDRYQRWMLGGVAVAAEETVLERSSEIEFQILDRTISALGDDDSLKSFFEAIPGFFNSKLVKRHAFPEELLPKFEDALNGFLRRTWSSNSVDDSEKLRRLDISMNAMNQFGASRVLFILTNIFLHSDEVPQTIEMGHTLARWCTSSDQSVAQYAQAIIAMILVSVRERNDGWVTLAARSFGLLERDLRDNIAVGDDSVLLAILIHLTRQYLRSDHLNDLVLERLSGLDIRNTNPRLQHDFCTLWNEIVQEARKQGYHSAPVAILRSIRHLYIALHQGTDAATTAFSAPTDPLDTILEVPSSFPFCNLASHRPDSPHPTPGNSPDDSSHRPTDGGNTASQQAEQVNIVMEPPSSSDPTTTSGATSRGPDMTTPTDPVHSRFCPAGASPTAVVAAVSQDITSTATLSHPPEGSEQQDSDIVTPSAEPGTSQIPSTASTHVPTPTLAPIPTPPPNTPSESYHAGVAPVSNSSQFAPPSIGSPIPASCPTGSAALPCLRPRGLVNTRSLCFANAVLQLLVNSPPFWNLFKELGNLKRWHGERVPETGGGATPLVDATVRFFKEFIVEDESPSTKQQSRPATSGTSRADEEKKDDKVVDSFEPTYMYDAMKEKRQLKPLLDGQQQDAEEFLCLYLDALDEELLALRQSSGAALEVEEREASQSCKTEVGSKGFMANFVESPTTRIFGGKFRLPVRTPNQPDFVPTEDWRSLHLDIQPDSIRTVQDTLPHISHPQSVQVSASGLGNTSQQVLIEALSPILVLHLNRVRYDAAAGGIKKIGKFIEFAPELEIPLDIMVPNAQRPSVPPHYKLYGVLYHHGESAGGGHYTVDVLHPNEDSNTGEVWLHIDNEAVSTMRHEDVFGEHGTEQAADERCAYLLFYYRTSPIGTS